MECKKSVEGRFVHDSGEEISKYKSDLVGVQVRWYRGGTEPEGNYIFPMKMEMRIMN
jgi:hypothetical protein